MHSDLVRVVALPRPLDTRDRRELQLEPGRTVSSVLSELGIRKTKDLEVRVSDGDVRIPEVLWDEHRLEQTDAPVAIRVVPAAPAIPFIIAALSYAAKAVAAYLGYSTLVQGAVALVVGVGGTLAARSLVKPATGGSLGGGAFGPGNSPTLRGATNQAYPYSPIWRVFGEHWVTPPLGAMPYTEVVGGKQYLRMLLTPGYGPLDFESWKIGDTLLDQFDEVELEYYDGVIWRRRDIATGVETPIPDGTIFKDDVDEEQVAVAFDFPTRNNDATEPSEWTARTSAANAEELTVELTFPIGLFQYGDHNTRYALSVLFEAQIKLATEPDSAYQPISFDPDGFGIYASQRYDKVTTGVWPNTVTTKVFAPGVLEIRARRTSTIITGFKVKPTVPGQYTVRIRRLRTLRGSTNNVISDALWTVFRSIRGVPRIVPDVTQIQLRILATDQLNGVVQHFRMKCFGKARPYLGVGVEGADAEGWGPYQRTRNPAWWFLHRLCDPTVSDPVPLAEIDLARIQAWAAYCEPSPGEYFLAFDHIRDYATTRFQMLQLIAGAGRATYTNRDGKHSVVIDAPKPYPVQMFSQRNTWNFQGDHLMIDLPHALRFNFTNEERENQVDELIVYYPGYDANSATKFETLELPGVTRRAQAFADGRKRMLESLYRRRRYSFETDFSYKVAERGDRVRIAHDVPLASVKAGRISALHETLVDWLGFTSDEELEFTFGESYSAEIMAVDDSTAQTAFTSAALVNPATAEVQTVRTHTATFVDPVEKGPTTDWRVGDQIAVGIAGQVFIDGLVHEVIPDEDDAATVVCSDYAEAIFEEDDVPPETAPIGAPLYATPSPPEIVNVDSIGDEVAVSWKILPPVERPAEVAGLQLQYRTATPIGPWTDAPPIRADQDSTRFRLELGDYYDFRLRTFSALQTVSRWSYYDAYAHLEGSLTEQDLEVVGLQAKGRGDNADWHGRDLELVWRLRVRGEELATPPAVLVGYRVRVTDAATGQLRRSETVTDPRYNYSLAKNQEDSLRISSGGSALAARSLLIAIVALAGPEETNAHASAEVERLFTNAAPLLPTVIPTETLGGINLVYATPVDPDFDEILVWRGATDDFEPSAATLIYHGRENPIFIDTRDVGLLWYRWAAADTFSRDPALLNLSEPVQLVGDLVDTDDIEVGAVRTYHRWLERDLQTAHGNWISGGANDIAQGMPLLWPHLLTPQTGDVIIPAGKKARVTLSLVLEPDSAHPANFPAGDRERYSVRLNIVDQTSLDENTIVLVRNVTVFEQATMPRRPESTVVTVETIYPDTPDVDDHTYNLFLAIGRQASESEDIQLAYGFLEVEVIKSE